MSSITISGDTSGSIILQAPSVAGSTTLTLPTTTGTLVTSNAMPTGSVLQVVQGTYTTPVTTTGTTYIDTGLTATITPSSSSNKILVLVNQTDCSRGNSGWSNNTSIGLKLVKNGSDLVIINPNAMYLGVSTVGGNININASYLDSPSSTSALTYKTQFKLAGSSGTVGVQWNGEATSTIILMEIKG